MICTEPLQSYLKSNEFLSALKIPTGTVLMFDRLGQGEYNLNYTFRHPVTGQKLVLRINTGSQMHLDDQISYEYTALQCLVPSGRTPKPLLCAPAHNLLVMEWLPGRALDYTADMDIAAHILADIHSVAVPAGCKLILTIAVECADHPQQRNTVAAADQIPVVLFPAVLLLNPGILTNFLSNKQRSKLIPG